MEKKYIIFLIAHKVETGDGIYLGISRYCEEIYKNVCIDP